ncbi:MAG TPA: TolC family protein, partial [Bacteroidia bacterium]|nr:TolC family protein [Bacteroidia bacterium]
MNTKKSILAAIALLCIGQLKVYSQADTATKQFTLQAAIDYALKHNMTYMNVENDAQYNTYKKKELTAQGLPQINGSADLRDNALLPTSLLPGQFFGAPAGTYVPVKFGVQYNLTASASATQLIFSSDYIVGLQAAKGLVTLSQKNVLRSKVETAQNVSKAYYGVLINKERIKILDINIDRVKTLKDNTTALNQNGFAEQIDVQRLEVNYNNLVTEKEKTLRLVEVSELMLKFQMGYDLRANIELTDNLNKIENGQDAQNVNSDKVDPSNRPEYMVLEAQQKLNELDLKRYRMAYLPSLNAYGLLAEQFQKSNLDFSSKSWFP